MRLDRKHVLIGTSRHQIAAGVDISHTCLRDCHPLIWYQ
jgi:hypothetical protein